MTNDIRKEALEWLNIMSDPDGSDIISIYWRLSGAADILNYLGIITRKEAFDITREYLNNHLKPKQS